MLTALALLAAAGNSMTYVIASRAVRRRLNEAEDAAWAKELQWWAALSGDA